jgi:hypothetical protein
MAEMPRARDALRWLSTDDESPGSPEEAAEADWPSTFAFERLRRFQVGDVEFHCSAQRGSTVDRFFIRKDRALVEEYVDVLDDFPRANIVELGIAEGGSVALVLLVSPPRKLVALELDETPVKALDELITRLALGGRVRPHYGVDQADRARVSAIVEAEFAEEPLDLVIDDASHRIDETRASFETLFPRLRPGGLYLIEDWHQQNLSRALGDALAADPELRSEFERRLGDGSRCSAGTSHGNTGPPRGHEVATGLILELVLAQAESDEFLSEMTIGPRFVRVRRGPGHLDSTAFRLSDQFTDHLGLLSP